LALANLLDESLDYHSVQTRLQQLDLHQTAWKSFDWNYTEKYPLHNVRLWELMGGVLAFCEDDKRTLMFTQFPSLLRGIEHKTWQITESEAFQFPEDFTIDPSRNLLVVLYRHASGSVFFMSLGDV
jgi:hypothetical protein